MNSILLTENEIREYEGIHGFNRVNYRAIAKDAAIHAVQYLEEPCDCLDHAQIVEFTIDVKGMYPHRYLCPDCMANIKKELGI